MYHVVWRNPWIGRKSKLQSYLSVSSNNMWPASSSRLFDTVSILLILRILNHYFHRRKNSNPEAVALKSWDGDLSRSCSNRHRQLFLHRFPNTWKDTRAEPYFYSHQIRIFSIYKWISRISVLRFGRHAFAPLWKSSRENSKGFTIN